MASANIECKNFALNLKSTTNLTKGNDGEEKKDIDDSIQTHFSSEAQSLKGLKREMIDLSHTSAIFLFFSYTEFN